jgi:hypothetical protein
MLFVGYVKDILLGFLQEVHSQVSPFGSKPQMSKFGKITKEKPSLLEDHLKVAQFFGCWYASE